MPGGSRAARSLAGGLCAFAIACSDGRAPVSEAPPARPNVLLIVADQMRASAVGIMGNEDVRTPNIDSLARQGARFTSAYTCSPNCSPSRAVLLAGKLSGPSGKTKVPDGLLHKLPLEETTIAEILRDQGYATGYIGKWHVSPDGVAREDGFVPPGPARQGFDHWAAVELPRGHYDTTFYRDSPEPLVARGFAADFETDEAIAFIRTRRDGPFFLMLSWNPPHNPYDPPPPHDTYVPGQIRLPANVPEEHRAAAREQLAKYYGLVSAVDANLGRLLAALEDLDLAGETIVVFTSDHGDMLFSRGEPSGRKRRPWRESSQVPLIVRYPAAVTPGQSRDMVVGSIDILPTILGLAGIPVPRSVQGQDVSPALRGEPFEERGSIFLYIYGAVSSAPFGAPWNAVRTRDGMFATSGGVEGGDWLLYDLRDDPEETKNLVDDPRAAGKKAEMRRLLDEWRARIGDDRDLTSRGGS